MFPDIGCYSYRRLVDFYGSDPVLEHCPMENVGGDRSDQLNYRWMTVRISNWSRMVCFESRIRKRNAVADKYLDSIRRLSSCRSGL